MKRCLTGVLLVGLILAECVSVAVAQKTVAIWKDLRRTDYYSGKMERSRLSIYLPVRVKDKDKPVPAIILCPGGSYCYLGMNVEGHNIARWLRKQGVAAFVLRYRVGMYGNHHPAMLQDLQRALQIVRENADVWGVDAGKVCAMGFSAGGHLVGSCGVYGEQNFMEALGIQPRVSVRPDMVAMIYPVVSMQDSLAHQKSRRNLFGKGKDALMGEDYARMQQMMSLELNVPQDMPPVFLLQCKDDPTVNYRNAVVLNQALDQGGVQHEFHFYQRGGHGFGIKPPKHADSYNWKDAFFQWMYAIEKQ